jgi:2-polyprenyl-6-methoxyphenol hydroxylase-like FAD-dependent oxidoreductase
LQGAKTFKLGYGQTAVIANVTTEREHSGIAYERFTESGPLALLPNNAPVWMDDSESGERRWSLEHRHPYAFEAKGSEGGDDASQAQRVVGVSDADDHGAPHLGESARTRQFRGLGDSQAV